MHDSLRRCRAVRGLRFVLRPELSQSQTIGPGLTDRCSDVDPLPASTVLPSLPEIPVSGLPLWIVSGSLLDLGIVSQAVILAVTDNRRPYPEAAP